MLDQPAADDRTQRRGDRAEGRPRPDGPSALLLGERCADDGEAARHEKRRPDSLHSAGDHELPHSGHEPTGSGRRRKERDAARIDSAPAEPVPHRTAHEQQGGEKECVGLDDPLDVGDRRPELALQRRQRHVDDGPIDEGETRPEDRRRQYPRSSCLRTRPRGGRREDDTLVAWMFADHGFTVLPRREPCSCRQYAGRALRDCGIRLPAPIGEMRSLRWLVRFWSTDRGLSALLGSLVAIIFVVPLLQSLPAAATLLVQILFTLVFVSGLSTITPSRPVRVVGVGVFTAAIALHWLDYVNPQAGLGVWTALGRFLAVSLLTVLVVRQVFREG